MKKNSLENANKNVVCACKLVDLKDAAFYVRTNEYILRGYRTNCSSFKNIFKSLFYIHNESVNVWSHIIGSLFVVLFFFYIIKLASLLEYNNNDISVYLETWPLHAFLLCALFCLTASSCYRLMGIYSEKLYNILHRLDYAGISILISGSCYPAIFYFFYTSPNIRNLYITLNTTFGVIVLMCSFFQFFGKPEMKPFRGVLYTVMGLSDAVPLFHICFFSKSVYGEINDSPRFVFWYIGGVCYIVGCLLYVKKIPEKIFPNKFDYFGSSHQIFHVLIVVGVVTHFIASLDAYEFRMRNII